jgi:hypothetical protein
MRSRGSRITSNESVKEAYEAGKGRPFWSYGFKGLRCEIS